MAYSFSFGTPSVDSPSARAFRKAAIDHLKRINPGRTYSSHVIASQPTLDANPGQPDAAGAAGPGRRRAGATGGVRQRESAVERDPGVRHAPGRNGRHESRHHHGDADLSAADVRAAARSLAGPAAARTRGRAGRHGARPGDQSPLRRKPTWSASMSRWGASCCGAAFRRTSSAPISIISGAAAPTSSRSIRGATGRSPMRPARRRARISSCCCAARCCGAIPMRSSISRAGVMTGAGGKRVPSEDVANEKLPVFTGGVQPDIAFFGFNVTPDQAVGSGTGTDQGYYVVIQQHPTEPRFGLDTTVSVGTASHLSIASKPAQLQVPATLTWGFNAAHMAGITRRRPVRLAIHASQFQSSEPAAQSRRPVTARHADAPAARCPNCSSRSPRRSPARKCRAHARSPAASRCSLPTRKRN